MVTDPGEIERSECVSDQQAPTELSIFDYITFELVFGLKSNRIEFHLFPQSPIKKIKNAVYKYFT